MEALIQVYIHYLEQNDERIEDICYTAAIGREHFNYRLALLVNDKKDLLKQLTAKKLKTVAVSPVDELILSNDLTQLVAEYLTGKRIDWEQYYKPYIKVLRKVTLPTYAFDTQRYWIETTKIREEEQLADDCYYEIVWQKEARLNESQVLSGRLWVISNESQFEFALSNQEINVQPHNTLAIVNSDKLPEDLLGIVFLAPNYPEQEAMQYQSKYARDFLVLAQALEQKKGKDQHFELGLILITQNAQRVREEDNLTGINSAPLGGMIKALRWEAPHFNPRWIDADDWHGDVLSKGVLAGNASFLALREGHWYSPTMQQAFLSTLPSSLETQGVHWITGGTGGLGLALAQYLVDLGVKELILSSRRGETTELSTALLQLREQASIAVIALDISDEQATKAFIKKQANRLTAIYHLAGMEHNSPWTEVTPDLLNDVFLPKVYGAWLLDKLSQSLKLNHFVLFSSISSAVGSNKQLAYLSANQYLDALASRRQAQGLPITCINWGPWAQVGMMQRQEGAEQLPGLLPPKAALLSLDKVLSNHKTGINIVTPVYLHFMLGFLPKPRPSILGVWLGLVEKEEARTQRSQLALDLLALTPELRYSRLMELVTYTLQTVLGISETPSPTKGFFELGIDSLMSVEVGRRLSERLGISLKPTAGFDYPTITELTQYLDTTLTEQQKLISYSRHELAADEPIAIIGMACRFPGGANTLEQFWNNLYEGVDAIGAVPKTRFDMGLYYDPDIRNNQKAHTQEFGFIEDIDVFDAGFFGISPREALLMDPQQRLLLQTTWHALEDAGIKPGTLKGKRVGVFVGIQTSEYANFVLAQAQENLGVYKATGNALSVAAGRIAYTLGTQGPTLSIDTACSSSLVALHEAARALRVGDCDLAIVAGVNSIIDPNTLVSLSNAAMLSVDGRCKTFDVSANGYGRSEGCGVVIVQAATEAKSQGARQWALLRSSQVNQDGASSGLTVPNGVAQVALLQASLMEAGLSPEDIDYIECHGTGTSLGDPIEFGALSEVYAGRDSQHPLIIGTVKTNIGHLESAAGIAGVIKTVLAMHHRYIPKHLHFKKLNPHINLDAIPAQIPIKGMVWQTKDQQPLRAGVSSFGFSGTNAHIILEGAPTASPQEDTIVLPENYLFVLSAKTQKSLDALIASYIHYLEQSSESIGDICYTTAVGREHFNYRLALCIKDKNELLERLKADKGSTHEIVLVNESIVSDDFNLLTREYLSGKHIDWEAYYMPYAKVLHKVSLPVYCFDMQRYWIEPRLKDLRGVMSRELSAHPFLGARFDSPKLDIQVFESVMSPNKTPCSWIMYFMEHLFLPMQIPV